VSNLRAINVTPHVAQNDSVTSTGKRRRSAIDGRTTRHQGYGIWQSCRAMTENASSAGANSIKALSRLRSHFLLCLCPPILAPQNVVGGLDQGFGFAQILVSAFASGVVILRRDSASQLVEVVADVCQLLLPRHHILSNFRVWLRIMSRGMPA
jgi:hypothetical protein